MNIVIIGCTSNICRIRVFQNLNKIHNIIENIFCVSRDEYHPMPMVNVYRKYRNKQQ